MERYVFNPDVDLHEVDQFGFIDLNRAYETGVIPSTISSPDESFNGVLNPSTLMHRAQDVFESTRQAQYVKDTLSLLDKQEKKDFEAAKVNVDTSSVNDGEQSSE